MPTCKGFYVHVTADELRAHLLTRARWWEADAERSTIIHDSGLDDSAILDVDNALQRCRDLRFLADHLVPGATYRLEAADIMYVELVASVVLDVEADRT